MNLGQEGGDYRGVPPDWTKSQATIQCTNHSTNTECQHNVGAPVDEFSEVKVDMPLYESTQKQKYLKVKLWMYNISLLRELYYLIIPF